MYLAFCQLKKKKKCIFIYLVIKSGDSDSSLSSNLTGEMTESMKGKTLIQH